MTILWALAVVWLSVCRGESRTDSDSDSLLGALDAINRRQRDLADPTLYYLEHFHPPRDIMYPRQHSESDGQPEDIGYGYQSLKSLAPRTSGIFEAIPLPESELGSHDPGVKSHIPDGKTIENAILEYIEENRGKPSGVGHHRYHYENPDMKRSVFRERDVNELPSALQNFYSEGEHSNQYFENGEHSRMPSSFRERLSSKISRNNPILNAHSLVRNFGSLNRDSDHVPNKEDDPDEYLSMLNSVWEKYQYNNPDNFDPEDLTERDVEEILEHINHKEVNKRNYDTSYENGYDFFNSPLAWVKRDRQRLTNSPKHTSDEFLHALKFLNGYRDTLESMRDIDITDGEKDADVARMLIEQATNNYKQHNKRFWRGNNYDDSHNYLKHYPITKRSSSFYTSPAMLYHKAANEKFNQRRKKNVKSNSEEGVTDPKVVKELNNIFSPSEETEEGKSNSTEHEHNLEISDNTKTNTTKSVNASDIKEQVNGDTHEHHDIIIHNHQKRSGQKEETNDDSQNKPFMMSKKSVDWSNYFGIDKRSTKSTLEPGNDEWLLDQYLKAYLISAKTVKDPAEINNEFNKVEMEGDTADDMDSKLQAMENMIVDQALKYTGAHEGVTDPEEAHTVSYKVMAQLLAAFSLEKMREALREFKSSIAAQKETQLTHTTTNSPTDGPEQKEKRVAIKKEKAEVPTDMKFEKKEEMDNNIGPFHSSQSLRDVLEDESCPVMDDITRRCKEIANVAGDITESLLSLCNLHQVCYLCMSELSVTPNGCDMTFLSQANNLCGYNALCRYTVRQTLAAMHSLRGDPSPLGCDWQNNPCLARYTANTLR